MNSCNEESAHRGNYGRVYDVITLATPEGGAGKSIFTSRLAAYWFVLGRKPALIDADPTETPASTLIDRAVTKRYNRDGPLGTVPVVAEPEERVGPVYRGAAAPVQPNIVHTAGYRNRTTITALSDRSRADPAQTGRRGCRGAIATYALIEELNATPEHAEHPIRAAMISRARFWCGCRSRSSAGRYSRSLDQQYRPGLGRQADCPRRCYSSARKPSCRRYLISGKGPWPCVGRNREGEPATRTTASMKRD